MNKRIKEMLDLGFDIIHGRASIYTIRGHINRIQVYSDDYRFPYSAVYNEDEIDIAVDKFILVINQIRQSHDKKLKERVKSV